MTILRAAVLSVAVFSQLGPVAPAPLRLPSLGVRGEVTPFFVRQIGVRINDVPVSLGGVSSMPGKETGGLDGYVRVSPYVLRHGENELEVLAPTDGETRKREAEVSIIVGDLDLESFARAPVELAASRPNAPAKKFQVAAALPAWRWERGGAIVDDDATRRSLYGAYEQLWRELDALGKTKSPSPSALEQRLTASTAESASACALAGRPDRQLAHLLRLATNRDRPDPLIAAALPGVDHVKLEVFARGALARLTTDREMERAQPLFTYAGGAYDAPRGRRGPTAVQFDVWFRREGKGAWVIDAVLQVQETQHATSSLDD